MTKIERAILLLVANGYAVYRVPAVSIPQLEQSGIMGFSIKEFCELHGISRSTFYQMVRDGAAPKVTKVGRRSIITREAAEAWRKQ